MWIDASVTNENARLAELFRKYQMSETKAHSVMIHMRMDFEGFLKAVKELKNLDRFPMDNGTTVDMKTAEDIYKIYSALHGTQQSLERLKQRGGFGWDEVKRLIESYVKKYGQKSLNELLSGK